MHWQPRYILDRIDPDLRYSRQGAMTAVTALISALLVTALQSVPESSWLLLTAVFILQARVGPTKIDQLHNLALTGIASIVVSIITHYAGFHPLPLALLLGGLTFSYLMMGPPGSDAFQMGLIAWTFAFMTRALPMSFETLMQRVPMMFAGLVLAMIITAIWPATRALVLRHLCRIQLRMLAEVNRLLAQIYARTLDEEEAERRLRQERSWLATVLHRLQDRMARLDNDKLPETVRAYREYLMMKLEQIDDLQISLATCRFRLRQAPMSDSLRHAVVEVHELLAHWLSNQKREQYPLAVGNPARLEQALDDCREQITCARDLSDRDQLQLHKMTTVIEQLIRELIWLERNLSREPQIWTS